MPARGLMAATVVLLLLAGGVWYSNREEARKQAAPPPVPATRMVSIPLAELRAVVVDRGGEHIRVERGEDGSYSIAEPAKLAGDVESGTSLFLQFSALDADRMIVDKGDAKPASLAPFGLDPPRSTITAVPRKGTPAKLLLGESSPTGMSVYAKLEGDARVFTLPQTISSGFEKTLKDLRDKRLVPFDRATLKSIGISAKGSAIELAPVKTGWTVNGSRGDGSAVDELLGALDAARMNPAATEESLAAAVKAWPTAAAAGTVSVTDSKGTHQIEVRRAAKKRDKDDKESDSVYLKSSTIEGVHTGNVELADAVAKGLAGYRNSRLFDFGFDDPERVEVKATGLARVLTQTDAKWMEAGKPIDPVGAQSLVDKLRELKASNFGANPGAATELELTVVSNGGQRTERVTISKLGATFVARREGEPEYYVLDPKAVSDLRQAAADVKEAVKPAAAPQKK